MQQHLLKEHYLKQANLARETSAEWRVYRHVAALLGGTGDLIWVKEELKKERTACLFYAARDGEAEDADYGTYGNYMMRKKDFYDEVIKDVLICHFEHLMK